MQTFSYVLFNTEDQTYAVIHEVNDGDRIRVSWHRPDTGHRCASCRLLRLAGSFPQLTAEAHALAGGGLRGPVGDIGRRAGAVEGAELS